MKKIITALLIITLLAFTFGCKKDEEYDPCDINQDGVINEREESLCNQTADECDINQDGVIDEKEEVLCKEETPNNGTDILEIKKNLDFETVYLKSESTGDPEGRIILRVQVPSNPRYEEGAPVIVYCEGGYVADGLGNKKMPTLNDMIIINFLYPGGTSMDGGYTSDGNYYDYRGENSIAAVKDVILYAAGELPDAQGIYIDELFDFPVLKENIGLIGFSFGGNMGIAVAALEEDVSEHLKYVIQWETPISSQIATRDLGRMLLQPLEKGVIGRANYFNPYYESYGELVINVDYSKIAYDPNSIYPIFIDGNQDGVFTAEMGPFYSHPVPDINENNVIDIGEDFGLDTYPYDTFDIDGKVVYSRPVAYALEDNNVFKGNWPEGIATVDETKEYWDIRESVRLYEQALQNIPDLKGMFALSNDDHVQIDPYKSHVHQAYDGWKNNGGWIKINPSPEYVLDVDPSLNTQLPDMQPNSAPADWEDLESFTMPEDVIDETYQIASVHEMADLIQGE